MFQPTSSLPTTSISGGSSPPLNTTSTGGPHLLAAPWVVPLLAAAATNAAAIIAFEIYVLVRAGQNSPSRRHLLLGQCLLVGLLLASLSALPITLSPSPLTCAATRVLVGVSSALVFGTLLVKCVFLISLNSGVYLPAHYQALLLFFIVLVQVSINTQWQWWEPASVGVVRGGGGEGAATGSLPPLTCLAPYRHLLLSLLYVVVLIVVVATLAIKCRGIRENYREATYIGAALGLVLPLWLAWTLAGLIVPPSLQPACLGFGIVATSTIVFVIMFIPKGRQLAAFGKDGLFREDREDGLSTFSGDGRYSPSFFLFKPVKASKEFLAPPIPSLYKTRIPEERKRGGHIHIFPPPPLHTTLPPPPAPPFYWPPPPPLPPPPFYHNNHIYHYFPGLGRVDDGVYTSIESTPAASHHHRQQQQQQPPPPPPARYPFPSNPNFYLFRSHAHTGMLY
ncbi:hypothetical protein Pcinc_018116 [Petrolisthes cinctipes]|uniref:G-protein coupled receptors family 3 profile domain-containing protein n=1 Tax=Petrolisthes cinctipes TaxID=88211 RepID=A0AAE1KMU8_PETCI|nr:hypothetical protein Pcinc_018116 [Petrolisthes cinctipes]